MFVRKKRQRIRDGDLDRRPREERDKRCDAVLGSCQELRRDEARFFPRAYRGGKALKKL